MYRKMDKTTVLKTTISFLKQHNEQTSRYVKNLPSQQHNEQTNKYDNHLLPQAAQWANEQVW